MTKISVVIKDEIEEKFEANKAIVAKEMGLESITNEQYLNLALTLVDYALNLDENEKMGVINTESKTCVTLKLPKIS